jgi:hypothetical protein
VVAARAARRDLRQPAPPPRAAPGLRGGDRANILSSLVKRLAPAGLLTREASQQPHLVSTRSGSSISPHKVRRIPRTAQYSREASRASGLVTLRTALVESTSKCARGAWVARPMRLGADWPTRRTGPGTAEHASCVDQVPRCSAGRYAGAANKPPFSARSSAPGLGTGFFWAT